MDISHLRRVFENGDAEELRNRMDGREIVAANTATQIADGSPGDAETALGDRVGYLLVALPGRIDTS